MTAFLAVRHNIEVAHRLRRPHGKCERIHGHSMWVRLVLIGDCDINGLIGGMDFRDVKHIFRSHLDSEYDHRLLLDVDDPVAELDLPGLSTTQGQPTTENIARWIGIWAAEEFTPHEGQIVVHETHVNEAGWSW